MAKTEKKSRCPHCGHYGLPNVVRSMGGRKTEYYCFKCGESIGVKFTSKNVAKEDDRV